MRKLMLCCATAAALIPVPAMPAQAEAPGAWPAQDALAYCRALQESEPDVSLGHCMSFFVTSNTGNLTQTCIYFDVTGQLDEFGITFAECVRLIRAENKSK